MPRGDWTPLQIILALRTKELTLNKLMRRENITDYHIPTLEKAISKALDIPLEELWPCWYKLD